MGVGIELQKLVLRSKELKDLFLDQSKELFPNKKYLYFLDENPIVVIIQMYLINIVLLKALTVIFDAVLCVQMYDKYLLDA